MGCATSKDIIDTTSPAELHAVRAANLMREMRNHHHEDYRIGARRSRALDLSHSKISNTTQDEDEADERFDTIAPASAQPSLVLTSRPPTAPHPVARRSATDATATTTSLLPGLVTPPPEPSARDRHVSFAQEKAMNPLVTLTMSSADACEDLPSTPQQQRLAVAPTPWRVGGSTKREKLALSSPAGSWTEESCSPSAISISCERQSFGCSLTPWRVSMADVEPTWANSWATEQVDTPPMPRRSNPGSKHHFDRLHASGSAASPKQMTPTPWRVSELDEPSPAAPCLTPAAHDWLHMTRSVHT